MVVLKPPNLHPKPISQHARETFTSPTAPTWCKRVLTDPSLIPISTLSREPKTSTEDSLFAETLATRHTIAAWQSFYRHLPQTTAQTRNDSEPPAGELVALLALGRGVNGHTDTAHGGILAAILDNLMGLTMSLYQSPGTAGYTVYMTVRFKRPLRTPGAVLCRGWLEEGRSGGRKLFVRGTVEDGEGGVFAEGEGLWVEVPEGRMRERL